MDPADREDDLDAGEDFVEDGQDAGSVVIVRDGKYPPLQKPRARGNPKPDNPR